METLLEITRKDQGIFFLLGSMLFIDRLNYIALTELDKQWTNNKRECNIEKIS